MLFKLVLLIKLQIFRITSKYALSFEARALKFCLWSPHTYDKKVTKGIFEIWCDIEVRQGEVQNILMSLTSWHARLIKLTPHLVLRRHTLMHTLTQCQPIQAKKTVALAWRQVYELRYIKIEYPPYLCSWTKFKKYGT